MQDRGPAPGLFGRSLRIVSTILLLAAGIGPGAWRAFAQVRAVEALPHSAASLTIDGNLEDALWREALARPLAPVETGVPADLGGEARLALRGDFLCFAARLPEPGGKILARWSGKNPIWEQDVLESPPLEDRVRFLLEYSSTRGDGRHVTIEINPWGGYRFEAEGEEISTQEVLRAALVSPDGWTVEAAVSLAALGLDAADDGQGLRVRVERIRSRRAQAPEFRWSFPEGTAMAAFGIGLPPAETTASRADATAARADAAAARAQGTPPAAAVSGPPEFRPPALGNTDAALEVGRVLHLPPVIADWDDPAWRNVPAFPLPRNEPYPRKPRYPTQIKWMHDGRTLAVLARLEEPDPVEADRGGRDGDIGRDDHFAVYLATSGSALLEIIVNPAGAIRDAVVRGPHGMRPSTSWDGNIETQTEISHGGWTLRMNIPLEECARALGESGVPERWRVLLTRLRAARPGEAAERSSLPVVATSSFYGPLRYRGLVLRDAAPARVAATAVPYEEPPAQGLAGAIARLDPDVWPPLEKRYRRVRSMVDRYLDRRVKEAVWAERQAWEQVESRQDWERFRDERMAALRKSIGEFPPERPPLDARVTGHYQGDGYRLENLVFQSRRNYWMTANLYLPAKSTGRIPGMIIVHSQHYPKTQGELHDMGELWARTGAAVLIVERPGYGERVETTPWYRQAYGSRFLFTKQLFLAGESYSGWAAWDVIRSVDYLLDRPDIDDNRILVLGSVAGGGEPAAVAAALDPRISAVVPFNYDQGHVRVHGDSPGQIGKQFSPWLVAASIAPRKFVRAFEFGWEGAEKSDYPDLWVDGLDRSREVWGFYDALDNLATSQAYGLIRLSMERVSHCFSIGPQQRAELYPILERWFGIPRPAPKDLAILPDSQLSTNPGREAARLQEAARRRPLDQLISMPAAASADVERTPLHRIAYEMGSRQLAAARERRKAMDPRARREDLRNELAVRLGDIAPKLRPEAVVCVRRSLPGADVEAVALSVEGGMEDGITVPLLLLLPKQRAPAAVVVAVAQGGKGRFLANRSAEITRLLEQGIAVCLPDVRATGETSPSDDRGDGGAHHGLAEQEFDLGGSLLGSQLRDLRTVLAYLRSRPDLTKKKLAVWGDSFVPPNPEHLYLDEIEVESSPQIQYRAEPMGAHLALLTALYEDDVQAVVARGGLRAYHAVLANAFTYAPLDVIVLGILQAGDIADISAAIAPRPQRLEGLVDGRNIAASEQEIEKEFAAARAAYNERNAPSALAAGPTPGDVAAWLAKQLE
jgi:dienelactone hydrolase